MPFAIGQVVAVIHVNSPEITEFCKVLAYDGQDYILQDLDWNDEDGDRGQWLCVGDSEWYRLSRAICSFVGPIKCD